MKVNKEQKHFFEKELIWKYPILFLTLMICIKILQYLDNTRPDPDILVGLFALFTILGLIGMTILGVIWVWFSVKPYLQKLLFKSLGGN